MKANELRIGNLVIVTNIGGYNNIGDTISIDSISKNGVNSWSDMGASGCNQFCEIEPIPLTEEWLLKFGFWQCNEAKITKRYTHEINPFIQLVSKNNWMSNKLVVTQRQELLANIQYVHQLQNLYFALTNTELEFK